MTKSPDDEYMEQLESEIAALKEQVAQLERAPEIESDEYKTWWGLALHVGAWKDHELDYVHFGSEMAVRAFAIHLLRQRDKFEAEQQQTITALQSKAAALVDALERIGDTACGEASHQYIALTALAALL